MNYNISNRALRGGIEIGGLTSIAFRRADCSHAWPSAKACSVVSRITKPCSGNITHPEEGVCKSVFSKVAKHFVINFKLGELC